MDIYNKVIIISKALKKESTKKLYRCIDQSSRLADSMFLDNWDENNVLYEVDSKDEYREWAGNANNFIVLCASKKEMEKIVKYYQRFLEKNDDYDDSSPIYGLIRDNEKPCSICFFPLMSCDFTFHIKYLMNMGEYL